MILYLRQLYWNHRLQKLVERNLNSFEIQQYRKHREAAKRGWQRRRGVPG